MGNECWNNLNAIQFHQNAYNLATIDASNFICMIVARAILIEFSSVCQVTGHSS